MAVSKPLSDSTGKQSMTKIFLFASDMLQYKLLAEFDEPADGMTYGAFLGCGFAAVWSLGYLAAHPDFTLFSLAYSASTNVLVYASVAALVGYLVGRTRFQKRHPGLSYALRRPKLLYGDGQLQTASRRHCHVPPGQSVDPFDGSVCVTRFANEPSPPYIRSGRMHLFHDPACGGFGPKRRNHSSTAAV